jgi:hypothetical protein
VRRDITAFVVTTASNSLAVLYMVAHDSPVNGDVEAEQLDEGGIVSEPEKHGQVMAVISCGIDCGYLSLARYVAIDAACNVWQFCNAGEVVEQRDKHSCEDIQVHAVFVYRFPVIFFGDAVLIRLGKRRVMVQLETIPYKRLLGRATFMKRTAVTAKLN